MALKSFRLVPGLPKGLAARLALRSTHG